MPPTTALLALTPVDAGALPPLTQAITWAEALHEALLKLSDAGREQGPSRCFHGRDDFGQPLIGHQHAAILPLALREAGLIDHVLIYSPMGFDAMARGALARLERLWIAPASSTLGVELTSLGERRELALRIPALGASALWSSVTPFVPSRHIKPRGRNTLEGQVEAELESWGLPRATSIEVQDDRRWRTFWVQRREAERKPPMRMGFGIRLAFSEAVEGPLTLGYGAHYGLGQLEPIRDEA